MKESIPRSAPGKTSFQVRSIAGRPAVAGAVTAKMLQGGVAASAPSLTRFEPITGEPNGAFVQPTSYTATVLHSHRCQRTLPGPVTSARRLGATTGRAPSRCGRVQPEHCTQPCTRVGGRAWTTRPLLLSRWSTRPTLRCRRLRTGVRQLYCNGGGRQRTCMDAVGRLTCTGGRPWMFMDGSPKPTDLKVGDLARLRDSAIRESLTSDRDAGLWRQPRPDHGGSGTLTSPTPARSPGRGQDVDSCTATRRRPNMSTGHSDVDLLRRTSPRSTKAPTRSSAW